MESLPVPSVQAMVAATGGAHVPARYLRPEVAADAVVSNGEAAMPIIDFEKLLHPDESRGESARLHEACQEWGFFQVWSTLDAYSAAVKNVADRLLVIMSKNLGLQPEVIANKCVDALQSVRMNCYPPCAQADKILGFSPHSDADLLTIVLQVNEIQGLQVKRDDDTWVPVQPLEGAFIVNVGDVLQIFTNGRYRSVEHRAVVDTERERMSIAAFHSPSIHATIGPLSELVADQEMTMYKTVDHESFLRFLFSAKLDGKSLLQRMKL
ncbi:hypothetical protein HU200_042844 [Digitaria exilis]|uniref:Fe2OG dioxygenase domain-containing protein n=1 Tax=Digitaria exilis TaxID=1010633 RepID=A0A835B9L4_9POAL|nr:hypothetical protein HU200_042844 [Digitaria exilis]